MTSSWRNSRPHFSTAIKQMLDLSPLPFCFDPTLDSCGLFTCAYSLPARPFDETHGTCCPFPFKEQSRAEQHTATCHLDLLFDSAKAASMFIPHCFVSRAVVCSVSFLHSLPFSFSLRPSDPQTHCLYHPHCWIPADTFCLPHFSFISISLLYLCYDYLLTLSQHSVHFFRQCQLMRNALFLYTKRVQLIVFGNSHICLVARLPNAGNVKIVITRHASQTLQPMQR